MVSRSPSLFLASDRSPLSSALAGLITVVRMYALRCTQRLLRKLRCQASPDDEARSTTALGDWFVREYNLGRHRLLLCSSSASLLTVVIPARNLPDMGIRLAAAVRELLVALGVPLEQINREIAEMGSARIARTNSRSVLGSMNDMAYMADAYLEGAVVPDGILAAELEMAETPCGPLGYRAPGDVALGLLHDAS
jgi:hypothetical protein